jgi:carbon-monoxide dehydrogenase medium subunit
MKPAPFDYVAPETIEEACQQLADAGGGATVIAGGQSLMPLLALRMSQPFILVDINRIPALRGITRVAGGIRIGALTRQVELIEDTTLASALPVLVTATKHVAHHQIRNRGTLGGSIALAEPSAELPAVAVALGASIEAQSTRGKRTIAAEELYFGPYSTALEPDELITSVFFPDWGPGTLSVFRELAPRPGDFALIGLAGALEVKEGKIARAGLAWFGMGPTPMKARRVEQALLGQSPDGLDAKALSELAIADTTPFDDHHASAEYRRTVGRRLFVHALNEALGIKKVA